MTDCLSVLGARDGKLFVASSTPAFSARYALVQGTASLHFEPVQLDALTLLAGVNLLVEGADSSTTGRWEVAAGEVALARNINREWVVEDDNPWVLTASAEVDRGTVRYVDPVHGSSLPVRPGVTYEAHGHFASPGASGRLRLVVLDAAGRVLGQKEAPVSNDFRGGTQWRDYQDVAVRLTMPPQATDARFEIEFDGHVPEPTSVAETAFLFFVGCGLVACPDRVASWEPLPESIPELLKVAAGRGRAGIYSAPLELGVGTGVTEARIVPLDGVSDTPVAKFALPDLSSVTATIGAFSGNAVRVTVQGYAGPLGLYVDGRLAGTTPAVRPKRAAGSRRSTVVVAEQFCDGSVHQLELRDSTGTQVLARSAELLPTVLTPWSSLQTYAGDPLPFHLAPAAGHRYRALRERLDRFAAAHRTRGARDDEVQEMAQLSWLHRVLELGFDRLTNFPELRFPTVDGPKVSVVVPAHNKFNVTYFCLAALLFAANDASFEVVVVDDGSSDDTLRLAEIAPGVTVCRNDVARGFVRACNVGAEHARGEYIVLLNNDTEPTVGWLDELLEAFDRFEGAGLAGSKLLYPDGRLQDAGGIVWSSGNPWNYGRGKNPAEPRFSYARQADYLSGAAVMLPRAVWDAVGGLSDEYAPAYFEDTDLAFKVREAGYTTWFVPSSVVYHFEGVSNGTDVAAASGLKRFQEINRPKFREKWSRAVVHNGQEGEDPDLVKDRGIVGRALFLDHGVPRPDRDAGSYAAIQEMRLVQSLGYKVTFAAINVAYLGHYSDDLNRLGVETIHAPFAVSVEAFLQHRGSEFDVVYITRYNVASQALTHVRKHAPQAKVLFCNGDLHFLREMRVALRDGSAEAWERAHAVREEELRVMREVDLVLSYNDVEHSVILSHSGAASSVVTCPWVVETVRPDDVPGFEERDGIAFLGGYLHPPNLEAVDFFVEQVVPRLRERLAGVKFNIYGSNMPERFRALADDVVSPIGYVESVEDVYLRHRIFVAPLLTGAGIKGKVLGALAHGLPSVLSPVAAESTGVREGYDCIVAHNVDEWVEAVVRLYDDAEIWQRMSRSAVEFTRGAYSFERGRELMRTAFNTAGILHMKP